MSDILQRLLRNDPKLVQSLHDHTAKQIFSFVLRYGGQDADAEDVYQDAALELAVKVRYDFDHLAEKVKDEEQLCGYFYRMAKFIWIKRQKNKNTFLSVTDPEVRALLDDRVLDEEYYRLQKIKLIQKHLGKISVRCRKLMTIMHFEGKSLAEAAEIMGISYKAAKVRSKECRDKFRTNLINDPEYDQLF